MKKALLAVILLYFILLAGANALSPDDFDFLLEREQFQLIEKYMDEFSLLKDSPDIEDRKLLLEYAQRTGNLEQANQLHFSIAKDFGSLEDALQWLILKDMTDDSPEILQSKMDILLESFHNTADSLTFAFYITADEHSDITELISTVDEYNDIIEAMAKSSLDELSVANSSYEAFELIEDFKATFPHSRWMQAVFYFEAFHALRLLDYDHFLQIIQDQGKDSAAHAFIASIYLLSPGFREDYQDGKQSKAMIEKAIKLIKHAQDSDETTVLYDHYSAEEWQNKLKLQMAKAEYYLLLDKAGLYGSEDDISNIFRRVSCMQKKTLKKLDEIEFANNDRGEQAELAFWKGKYHSLFRPRNMQKRAIKHYGEALIKGAPRKKYDDDAHDAITAILARLRIKKQPIEYLRKVFGYTGITFEDTRSMEGKRYTRIALADYDNDGLIDILFNGKHIYHNDGSFNFSAHPDTNLTTLNSSGGIWGDFNKDGLLDFVSISHSPEAPGNTLMKQMPDGSFVSVNAKAGDIDDGMPSEGLALIDIDGDGFPSLYIANYEKWQQQSGFPDMFWHNNKGTFTNKSEELGFWNAPYTTEPGLAGRGVATADFDNDGKQEILVTNYRLNRNFLFKQSDHCFFDLAALYGVAGNFTDGYYGHSIGADWGDFDNDGDLDLIIANLAHPRFIDFSDKTMLLRNDGMQERKIGEDIVYYWLFTDVTKESGITYDELHAEPLFFDADNDGYLDIYITSVYENDRSYLYRNNGDGTFTDITYLSGSRVYNGWSCAAGDLNRDGLIDLVIGSGNGTKILANTTNTKNQALYLKPVHHNDEITITSVDSPDESIANSPAFGTRILVHLKDKDRTYTLTRELSSAKGTTTQNAPELHFGLGKSELIGFEIWQKD